MTIVTLLGINSRYVKAIHYDNMTIVTLIIGSSVDIFVKAIGGMTIVTLFSSCFVKAINYDYSHTQFQVFKNSKMCDYSHTFF